MFHPTWRKILLFLLFVALSVVVLGWNLAEAYGCGMSLGCYKTSTSQYIATALGFIFLIPFIIFMNLALANIIPMGNDVIYGTALILFLFVELIYLYALTCLIAWACKKLWHKLPISISKNKG